VNDLRVSGGGEYIYDFEPIFAPIVRASILTVFMGIPSTIDLSRLMFIGEDPNGTLMSAIFSISSEECASPILSQSQPASPISPRFRGRSRISLRPPFRRCDHVRDIDITSAMTQTRSLLYSALDQMVMNSAVSSIAPLSELILSTPLRPGAEHLSIAVEIPPYPLPDACSISFDLFLTGFYSNILMSDAIQLSVSFVTIPSISAVSPQVHRDPDASAVLSESKPAVPAPYVPPPSDGRSRVTFFRVPSVPGNYRDFDIRSIPELIGPSVDPIILGWCRLSITSSLEAVSELVRPLVLLHDSEHASHVFPPYDLPGPCSSSFESFLLAFYSNAIACHIVQLFADL
jgi:hypothetical protein